MGRHSRVIEDERTFSTRLVIVIVLVIVLILAAIAWVVFGPSSDSDNADQKCSGGDLALPIAESSPGLAQSLIDAYSSSNPVIQDKCVTPVITPNIAQAALYISQGDPRAAVKKAKRTVVDPINPVQVPLGVNVASTQEMYNSADQIVYPVKTDGEVAAVAATYLSNSVESGTMLLQRDATLTVKQALEQKRPYIVAAHPLKDYTFHLMRATARVDAAVLASTDTVSKEQVEAATAMVTYATENPPASDVNMEDVRTVQKNVGLKIRPTPTPAAKPSDNSDKKPAQDDQGKDKNQAGQRQDKSAQAADTLFLLDTSDAMTGENYAQAADAIKQVSGALVAQQHQVALWNYSSPLNPGVTKGWRSNVAFGDGAAIASTLDGFGTGGYPWTRSAVIAALGQANEQAQETGKPVSILLITTGTQEEISDQEFGTQLDQAANEKVSLKVIHVGAGTEDAILKQRAAQYRAVKNPVEVTAASKQVLGVQ